MARIVEDSNKYETWKNATRSTVVLKKHDRKGNLVDEVIRGGKIFAITPEERRMNQEIAANQKQDMFMNGLLAPVRLLESSDDVQELQSNPNHMTDEDIIEVFKIKSAKAFKERVSAVTNPLTLKRMLEVAHLEEANAMVKQVEYVTNCLKTIQPALYNEVEVVSPGPGATSLRPTEQPSSKGPRDIPGPRSL